MLGGGCGCHRRGKCVYVCPSLALRFTTLSYYSVSFVLFCFHIISFLISYQPLVVTSGSPYWGYTGTPCPPSGHLGLTLLGLYRYTLPCRFPQAMRFSPESNEKRTNHILLSGRGKVCARQLAGGRLKSDIQGGNS